MAIERSEACDVLVIGGGTAGFGAALAAARNGARVRLLEAGSKIGGVMAFCPGMPWGGGYPTGRTIGGVFGELTDQLLAAQPPAAEVRRCTLDNFGYEVVYDHEAAVFAMFELLEQAGVEIHLGTIAQRPEMAGNRIAAVHCHDRRGPLRIEAGMVIDCSGDGDISAKAGVPFTLGDGQGNMMGVTLSFTMINAPWDQVFARGDPYFAAEAAQGIAQGRLHPDLAKLYLMRGFHADSVFCNSVHIRGVDGTDPRQVVRATQEGRRRCHQLARFLIESVPGFERARMVELGPTVGVRETRRLEALHRISTAELGAATKYADGIVCCDNPIDDVMRSDAAMTHEAIVGKGEYYTIPFCALVPRTIANLLFAGRLVCADPAAFASVRGMPQCIAMGQAAGTAAALALAAALPVQDLDLPGLVARLQAQGLNGLGDQPLSAITAAQPG